MNIDIGEDMTPEIMIELTKTITADIASCRASYRDADKDTDGNGAWYRKNADQMFDHILAQVTHVLEMMFYVCETTPEEYGFLETLLDEAREEDITTGCSMFVTINNKIRKAALKTADEG